MNQFKAGLRFEGSSLRYVVGGHPAPARAHSQVAGSYKGVAVISKHPTRVIPTCWPESIQKSSRALVSATYLRGQWITAGTMYGEPESGMYPRAKFHNEALLHALVSQVCFLASGPRYIAGDFNSEVDSLPSFDLLTQCGFKDIQTIALERWGCQIQCACKQRTRKDFLFLSPELQVQLASVHVTHDLWPDHAVLHGVFRSVVVAVPRTVWTPPKEFPWPPNFEVSPNCWPSADIPVEVKYEQVWSAIENAAAQACPQTVPKRCFGRGRSSYTKTSRLATPTPMKMSRKGDIVPLFAGHSWKYSCWFRQARRLQHFARHVSKGPQAHQSDHASLLWNAILHAKGFDGGFAHWFQNADVRAPNAPACCPVSPPDACNALGVSMTMLFAVRNLEKDLRAHCGQYARMRRLQNPMAIFQDLKEEAQCSADVFISTKSTKVDQISQGDLCIITQDPVEWDSSLPIYCGGKKLDVVRQDYDSIWVTCLDGIAADQVVTQQRFVGDPDQILQEFSQLWEARWLRHAAVPESQWDQILAFARVQLPRACHNWPSMTPIDLQTCIRHKKSRTSKWLDGVTIRDLRSLPISALNGFCNMFLEAECTAVWPPQVTAGRITAIPKNSNPGGPDEFRPITILGLLYRTWGTYHAKKALSALNAALPDGLHGSRPGCFAGQLWSKILWAIDHAHAHRFTLSGVAVDLTKAFNFLPRHVTAEALALLGIPFRVLRGWHGALKGMKRRFQLNQILGREIDGLTGYPEGDALSVLAMVGINCIFHAWMNHQSPLCMAVSYVDDWQLITCSATHMEGIISQLDRLVSLLDLHLDGKKSYLWSTCAATRKEFLDLPYATRTSARSLGAHIQMSRQHTNWSQMTRIEQMAPLWNKLQYSAAGYHMKVRALRMAAWPRGLHGIAATSVALQTFKDLRSAALRALNSTGAGVNAAVHLGLIENCLTDPHFWTIFTTLQCARMAAPHHEVLANFRQIAQGTFRGPRNGITTTLANRVRKLGWSIATDGRVADRFGVFNFLTIGKAELMFRMHLAWPTVVASWVDHRSGFQGLAHADISDTRLWLRGLNLQSQGAFRKILNGAHITQDSKRHCDRSRPATTDQCIRCGCSDSRFHRFWICEAFAPVRDRLPDDMLRLVPSLPESLVSYGWSLSPHTLKPWLQTLQAIPDVLPSQIDVCLPPGPWLHVFTDGSCEDQGNSYVRFASWGLVVAHLEVLDYTPCFTDAGHLPGILQSSYRAETFAVLRALHLAWVSSRAVHIWSDCSAVVSQLRALTLGRTVATGHPHGDLWRRIANYVKQIGPGHVRVASHVENLDQPGTLDDWGSHWNAQVDAVAGSRNLSRPDAFWTLLEQHRLATRAAREISRHVQTVQLEISLQVLQEADQEKAVEDDPVPESFLLFLLGLASRLWPICP